MRPVTGIMPPENTSCDITDDGRALLAQLRQKRRENVVVVLKTLSPDNEATLGLAMLVAAPLPDELKNFAANNLPSNVFAPGLDAALDALFGGS